MGRTIYYKCDKCGKEEWANDPGDFVTIFQYDYNKWLCDSCRNELTKVIKAWLNEEPKS